MSVVCRVLEKWIVRPSGPPKGGKLTEKRKTFEREWVRDQEAACSSAFDSQTRRL